MRHRINWNAVIQSACGWVICVLFIYILMSLLQSCATIQAVTAAPEEFWITIDTIFAALLDDLWTLIDLLL